MGLGPWFLATRTPQTTQKQIKHIKSDGNTVTHTILWKTPKYTYGDLRTGKKHPKPFPNAYNQMENI